jgi:hypothetical protein
VSGVSGDWEGAGFTTWRVGRTTLGVFARRVTDCRIDDCCEGLMEQPEPEIFPCVES